MTHFLKKLDVCYNFCLVKNIIRNLSKKWTVKTARSVAKKYNFLMINLQQQKITLLNN